MKSEVIELEISPASRGDAKKPGVSIKAALDAFLESKPGVEIKYFSSIGNIQPGGFSQIVLVIFYEQGESESKIAKAEAKSGKK